MVKNTSRTRINHTRNDSRSKTCPQCRSKVDEKNTIKLYFQLSSYPTQDTGTLENTVHNLKFQLKIKEIDVNKLTEEHDTMKKQIAGLKYGFKPGWFQGWEFINSLNFITDPRSWMQRTRTEVTTRSFIVYKKKLKC